MSDCRASRPPSEQGQGSRGLTVPVALVVAVLVAGGALLGIVRTALLDYVLCRQYFPLRALGLYEQRRRARLELTAALRVQEPEAIRIGPRAA